MMDNRLDELLARLPSEPPAPDLSASIIAAVGQRRQARMRWRLAGVVAMACAFVGVVLIASSWPIDLAAPAPAVTAPDADAVSQAVSDFLAAPSEALTDWVGAALAWETALAEGTGAALLLGIVLLTVAIFGGLARLLRGAVPLNGYSQ
jgi:NaMN:DMB phosphoribosyltransferase